MIKKLLSKFVYKDIGTTTTKNNTTYLSFNFQGISYEIISDSTVKVVSSKTISYANSVNIPPTVTYQGNSYQVTSIGACAFANHYKLNNITLPHTINTIEEKAFANDYGLVQIICHITKPLNIHQAAFGYVTENCTLIVPTDSLTAYKTADIWKNFKTITNIYPFTVAGIRYQITSKKTVKVTLNIVDDYTGSITIPSTVKYHNTEYKVTEISDRAFSFNKKITSVRIGSNITTITNSTFNSCSNLAFVYIPNSVTHIGSFAFEDCVRLSCITIPSSINTIESSAFSGSAVNRFTFSSAFASIKTVLICAFYSFTKKPQQLVSTR